MNYNILQLVYGLGQHYPFIGRLFVFISGPFSFIILPAVLLITLSVKLKENFMQTFSLIFLSVVSSYVVAHTLKAIFKIARPYITHPTILPLTNVSGYSFPSEHASVYGALTMILFHFDYRLGIVLLFVSMLVMVSRVVVGVHYPVDVVVGFCVGLCVSYGIIIFFKKFL